MVTRVVGFSVLAAALLAPEVASACSIVPPSTAISIGMSPASPSAGAQVRLTGGAGADRYAWDLDGDGQFDDATGKDVTATFPAGERVVRAQASTPDGILTDSRTFTVHSWNGTPTGTVSASPPSARIGAPVQVTAKGSDPDGSVRTDLDLDGDGTFETAGATGTASFASAGERVVRARFTDDGGATSVATTTVDVHTGNLAPAVRLEYSLNSCFVGWQVEASDHDGTILRYEYDTDGDGTYETDRGGDARPPAGLGYDTILGVRVTDDTGATATARQSARFPVTVPSLTEVGRATTLAVAGPGVAEWDADGDGEFDDGTGGQISFTYPAAGTYTVRARVGASVSTTTISVRPAADIGVPEVRWTRVGVARADRPAALAWTASGPTGVDANVDLDGNGVFSDVPAGRSFAEWTFGAPATVAAKATDARGRTAVTTSQVPFLGGNLGPDATIGRTDGNFVWAGASDPDGPSLTPTWDTDGDGAYDDSPPRGELPGSFGVRATDAEGATVTLSRTLTSRVVVKTERWLQVSARRPSRATLLRRGITVDVRCTKPKCRTRLVAKLDAKAARKVNLRSRTVAQRTVSGTRRVTLELTPKARRALKRAGSIKLALTASASAEGGAKTTWTQTLTVRRPKR